MPRIEPPTIGENIIIMTRANFHLAMDKEFQRGVERGKFEARIESTSKEPGDGTF